MRGLGILAIAAISAVAIVCLILMILLMPGLTPTHENPPVEPAGCAFLDEEDHFVVQFGLNDADGDPVRADGIVVSVIQDKANVELYNRTFTVTKSQFKWYTTVLGTKVLAYKWEIPYTEVNKTYGTGLTLDGSITFIYGDTAIKDNCPVIGLPDALKTTIEERMNVTINDHGRVQAIFHEKHVYVNLTVENISPIPQKLWGSYWKIETDNTTIYNCHLMNPNPPDELASGESFTWMICFAIPIDEAPVKIIYHGEIEIDL